MSDHYIVYATGVDAAIATRFANLLNDLRIQQATKVIIGINCLGGNVVAGFGMYNLMLAMPYEIETHNTGNIDSIANVIFLGGSKRYTNPSSTFMFHGVSFAAMPNEVIDENNARAKLDTILADHKRMSAVLALHTRIKQEDAMIMFKEQNTRDAVWAKARGVVDDIREFQIPVNATVHMFV